MRINRHRGFTVIEISIVFAIVALLATMAVMVYANYTLKNRINACIRDIQLFEQSIKAYQLEHGAPPDSLSDLGAVTLYSTIGGTKQTAPFLDPWGNPYRYLNLVNDHPPAYPNARRDKNNHPLSSDYDLYSMGADGVTAKPVNNGPGADDIIRANDGGYIGLGAGY
ncbi:MAG: type II secretion system protein GspG [Deltaproteobacteria bacterium]|nr:type II secretion system protein GspG [Deltaproteobacteria bacterium]